MEQVSIIRFEYEGFPISFDFGDGTKLINATEMVKPFNKLLKDFFRLQQTAEYIDVLHKSLKMSRWENSPIGQIRGLSTENLARIYPELIKVVKGGNQPQGTWVHEKIALKFAAWLSPYFELWIYDRIHELLTTGKTEIPHPNTDGILKSLRMIVDQLELQEKTNLPVGKAYDAKYGVVNTYHIDVLKEVVL